MRKWKDVLLEMMIGFLLVSGLAIVSHAETWSSHQSGYLYVAGAGEPGGTLVKIPAVDPFNAIQVAPVPLTFTAAAGSTIVANYDFWASYAPTNAAAANGMVPEYVPYSQTLSPWRHIDSGYTFGKRNIFSNQIFHGPVWIGNTPTAASSGGGAATVGQTYRWEAWTQDSN